MPGHQISLKINPVLNEKMAFIALYFYRQVFYTLTDLKLHVVTLMKTAPFQAEYFALCTWNVQFIF